MLSTGMKNSEKLYIYSNFHTSVVFRSFQFYDPDRQELAVARGQNTRSAVLWQDLQNKRLLFVTKKVKEDKEQRVGGGFLLVKVNTRHITPKATRVSLWMHDPCVEWDSLASKKSGNKCAGGFLCTIGIYIYKYWSGTN